MKRIFLSLFVFTSLTAFAQDAEVQSGTPSLMEVINGKKASVYLQKYEGGNLTFQPRGSSKGMTVPADKIKSLRFSMSKEEFDACRENNIITSEQIAVIFENTELGKAEKLEQIFVKILENIAEYSYQGDYAGFVSAIEPFMLERGEYMAIDNNLADFYVMLMESYRKLDNLPLAKKCIATLLESSNDDRVEKAKVSKALVAIAENDIATADTIRGELSSEAAALFLQASVERANSNYKQAMQIVTTIIADHANDREWMPQSELLAAYLYLDMTGTNSVISTNSVINTSRQVKNIYAGSDAGGDARKLWASLGGEAIEEAENIAKAERAAAEKKAKEEREAAREAARKARKAEQEAAKAAKKAAAAAASTNLTTTTETESE